MHNNVKSFWENIYKNTSQGGRLSESEKLKNFRLKYEIKNIENFINKFSTNKKNNNFLDLGCGEGLFSNYFQSKGYNVTGIDISETQILKNKNKFKNIDFISADITNTNIYKKKFNIIFIGGVLMYIDNTSAKKTLNHLLENNLNEGGIIILRESILINGEKNQLKDEKYPVYYRNINYYNNNFKVIYRKNNLSYTTGFAYSKLNTFLYYILLPFILIRQIILTYILKQQNQIQYFYIIKK